MKILEFWPYVRKKIKNIFYYFFRLCLAKHLFFSYTKTIKIGLRGVCQIYH